MNGFLILIFILAGVCFMPYPDSNSGEINDTRDRKMLDSLEKSWANMIALKEKKEMPVLENPVPFIPDTLNIEQWKRYGCEERVAHRIINYHSKGGKFRSKNDLKKIYGMESSFFEKIKPFIALPDSFVKDKHYSEKREIKESFQKYKKADYNFSEKKTTFTEWKMELNSADTSDLIRIYGVGEKLSMKILKYKKRLGGFITLEQLREIKGIDSSNYSEIIKHFYISDTSLLKKLNLNSVTLQELGTHPYIGYRIGEKIIAYREQHGNYERVEDVLKIITITKGDLERMRRYVKVE